MDSVLFEKFRTIAYDRAGITLGSRKHRLVSARVAKRRTALGIRDEEQYLQFLESDTSGNEIVKFLDAISTNFTGFFRERDHFDLLAETLKFCIQLGQRRIRLWSAASSTGEEPYSMSITVSEVVGDSDVDVKILATDISTEVLARARSGRYDVGRIQPVPENIRSTYFHPDGRRTKGGLRTCVVDQEIKNRIVFKRLNLSAPPFPMNGPLDMVFCRNVMIYFDRLIRQGLISEIERLLKPTGFLVVGHSETLTGICHGMTTIRPSVYQKPRAV